MKRTAFVAALAAALCLSGLASARPGVHVALNESFAAKSGPGVHLVGWSPAWIVGLSNWWRADQGVATSGANVTSWADYGSLGNTAAQAVAGQQPTVTTLDGNAAVGFTTSQALSMAATTPIGAKTVFVVFQMSSTPATSTFYVPASLKSAGSTFTDVNLMNVASYQSVTFCADYASSTTGVGVSPVLDTKRHALVFTYSGGTDSAPASYAAALDGVGQVVVASSTVLRTATDLASIGGRVSSANAVSSSLKGAIAEIGVLNHSASVAEIAQLGWYLGWRYP